MSLFDILYLMDYLRVTISCICVAQIKTDIPNEYLNNIDYFLPHEMNYCNMKMVECVFFIGYRCRSLIIVVTMTEQLGKAGS